MRIKPILIALLAIIILAEGMSFAVAGSVSTGIDGFLAPHPEERIGIQATSVSLGPVIYYVNGARHTLDKSDPNIYINNEDSIIFSVTGKYNGPSNSHGFLWVGYQNRNPIGGEVAPAYHAKLIAPGETARIMTEDPPYWHPGVTGDFKVSIAVYAQGGSPNKILDITIHQA